MSYASDKDVAKHEHEEAKAAGQKAKDIQSIFEELSTDEQDHAKTKAQGLPSLNLAFPVRNVEGTILAQLTGGRGPSPEAAVENLTWENLTMSGGTQTRTWCYKTTQASAPHGHHAGNLEEVIPEVIGITDTMQSLDVFPDSDLPVGMYCCPGDPPNDLELVREDCQMVQEVGSAASLQERRRSPVSGAKMFLNTTVSESIGKDDLPKAAAQIAQLIQKSPDGMFVLVDAHAKEAVVSALQTDEVSKQKVFVRFWGQWHASMMARRRRRRV